MTTEMNIAILGRIPAISLAELEQVFGAQKVSRFSQTSVVLDGTINVQELGGCIKAGRIILTLSSSSWSDVSKKIIQYYGDSFSMSNSKKTLGLSVYDWDIPPRQIQKIGLDLKSALKRQGIGLRLIPNSSSNLSSATSHHNKLGLSPVKLELLIVRGNDGSVHIAESTGSQNISALASRDQGRPKRDAFVGMLPPKLALSMVNMTGVSNGSTILDPFCGTGVVLQEALLRKFNVVGSDLADKMVDYSRENIEWLRKKYYVTNSASFFQGDAMKTSWSPPIDAVVSEIYLGQPFSAPPSTEKLAQVRKNCDHIASTFLQNVAPQLTPNTPLCLAIPAWRDRYGNFTHLSVTRNLSNLGFKQIALSHVQSTELLYFREDQIVAREILLIEKI